MKPDPSKVGRAAPRAPLVLLAALLCASASSAATIHTLQYTDTGRTIVDKINSNKMAVVSTIWTNGALVVAGASNINFIGNATILVATNVNGRVDLQINAGEGTNAVVSTNGITLGATIGTFSFDSGVTGYVSGAVAHLGMNPRGKVDELNGVSTNQTLYARTNPISAQGITALATNIFQFLLTNGIPTVFVDSNGVFVSSNMIVRGSQTNWNGLDVAGSTRLWGSVTLQGNLLVNGGDITHSALTASTVLYGNSSKQIVSIANGTGALTNDGAGGVGWNNSFGGGGAGSATNVLTGREIWVDNTLSAASDSNAGTNAAAPKLTLAGAVSAATMGDLIHVRGRYSERGLAKNGVSWLGEANAELYLTNSTTAQSAVWDFSGANASTNSSITWKGTIYISADSGANVTNGLMILGSGSDNIRFNAEKILFNHDLASSQFRVFWINRDPAGAPVSDAQAFQIHVRDAQSVSASSRAKLFQWDLGRFDAQIDNLAVNEDRIIESATNNTSAAVLRLGNVVTTVGNSAPIWLRGSGNLDLQLGYATLGDSTGILATNGTLRTRFGYYSAGLPFDVRGATVEATGLELSMTNGWGAISAGTLNLAVLKYTDASAGTASGFTNSGGTLLLDGGELATFNGPGISHGGGTTRIKRTRIDTTASNVAKNAPILVTASGVTLDNVTLVAPASTFGISAPGGAQTVSLNGWISSNKGFTNNITLANGTNYTVNLDATGQARFRGGSTNESSVGIQGILLTDSGTGDTISIDPNGPAIRFNTGELNIGPSGDGVVIDNSPFAFYPEQVGDAWSLGLAAKRWANIYGSNLNLSTPTASRVLMLNGNGDATNVTSSAASADYVHADGSVGLPQQSSMVLSNLVGLASTVFTNVPAGGTNISVRTTGGTNFIDTTGQLNNWSQFTTNIWNSRQGGTASLTNLSGNPNVATNILGAGTVTVTSNNLGTWTITGTASGGGSGTNFEAVINLVHGTNVTVGSPGGVRQSVITFTNGSFKFTLSGSPFNGEEINWYIANTNGGANIFATNTTGIRDLSSPTNLLATTFFIASNSIRRLQLKYSSPLTEWQLVGGIQAGLDIAFTGFSSTNNGLVTLGASGTGHFALTNAPTLRTPTNINPTTFAADGSTKFTYDLTSPAAGQAFKFHSASVITNGVLGGATGYTNVINLRMMGAVGDDSTDDTAAVNSAIAKAGGALATNAIYVPAGTYLVDPLAKLPTNLVMFGEGPRLSSFRLRTKTNNSVILVATNWGIHIRNLGFLGTNGNFVTGTPFSATGIVHSALGGSEVDNCFFDGWRVGLAITAPGSSALVRPNSGYYGKNVTTNCGNGIITFGNNLAEYIRITANHIYQGEVGIWNQTAGNVFVENNVVVDCTYPLLHGSCGFNSHSTPAGISKGNSKYMGNVFNHGQVQLGYTGGDDGSADMTFQINTVQGGGQLLLDGTDGIVSRLHITGNDLGVSYVYLHSRITNSTFADNKFSNGQTPNMYNWIDPSMLFRWNNYRSDTGERVWEGDLTPHTRLTFTNNATLQWWDQVVLCHGSNQIITLPRTNMIYQASGSDISYRGKWVDVISTSPGAFITVQTNQTGSINGQPSTNINGYGWLRFMYGGTNWYVK